MNMKIKELFAKPIDRDIQGVIKVSQESNIKVELDEYVVTRELQDQFAKFFSAYEKALQGPTDDMGVWISGFFGSGKSHFLKILSYILENREVDGRPAVEFFADKINDSFVYTRMQAAANSNTQVILFNIDSKAMNDGKTDSNVILDVFLRVFNEMQGYSNKNHWIADLERQLDERGHYEAFKTAFHQLETNGLDWNFGRDHYSQNKGTIRDALVQVGYMSEADAQGFVDNLFNRYPINIENFAQLVNAYIQKTGQRVAFLVDEVGQFVGDSVQRMLNLQTVVEELGSATKGKAWVIVTSQQAIGDVTTNLNGQDFSKIQGRFKTRIALSSANVDEVIKRRLLTKTTPAQMELEGLYQGNAAALRNAIDFDDGVTRQKFSDPAEFALNYPFVPYQFNLLQDVLTAVRNHGSDGKHLSEGERSMLSIFQESAMRKMDAEEGQLVPFSLFFEGLAQFLDHTHNIVIQRAWDNPSLNPNREKNPFTLQVLKTLFMVKYLDSFKATLNNLVTLMIDDVNVDRIALTKQTQEALAALIREGVVEKHFDLYIFLTDAEQDINDGIEHENVIDSAIAENLQQYFFGISKTISDRYTYPKLHNRYVFAFNRWLDGKPYGRGNQALTIQLITPQSDYFGDESTYAQLSTAPDTMVIALPDDRDYIDLTTRSLKIKQYVLGNTNNQDPRFRLLLDERQDERTRLDQSAQTQALDALERAQIFVAGAPISTSHDFAARLEEAEKALIDNNYRSLDYIDAAKSEQAILSLLNDNGLVKTDENSRAVDAVFDWLQQQLRTSQHVTLKSVLNRFATIPYGYTEEDTEWLVAALLKAGRVKLSYNGEPVSLMQDSARQVTEYLTKKQYAERIAIQVRYVTPERDLKKLREVAKEVFKREKFGAEDLETVTHELQDKVGADLKNLEHFEDQNRAYPGHDLIEMGISYLRELQAAKDSDAFVATIVKRSDDLLDWHDEYVETDTQEFYLSAQMQKVWDDGLQDLSIYDRSKDFLADAKLTQIAESLRAVLKSNRAKGNVRRIKELDEQFDEIYSAAFDQVQAEKLQEIDETKQSGLDYLQRAAITPDVAAAQQEEFLRALARIRQEAADARALDELNVTTSKAKTRFQRMTSYIENLKPVVPVPPVVPVDPVDPVDPIRPVTPVKPPVHRIKTVQVRDVSAGSQWRISSAAELDHHLATLRQQLLARLKDADEIDLHF
ncbi:BREX system P-loop protein BrxC [Lacticaseibacillus absianus]|uniref:BREX system P-loop protein BrxC n=1 Tax=Lacticaseibacillus absianus TaxID=2729623 RepID=UPI0015CAD061|nr:BREX system P-loop protein BrxC [Lacticaseibacillus absianus]